MQNQQLIGSAIKKSDIRFDLQIIAGLIKEKSKVLDIGCGSGDLLHYLKINKKSDCRGLEISQTDVSLALSKGISVMQGNAENDLVYYPDDSFDYAILSQTLQATKNPDEIIKQMLRIAKFAIISFPNFAHYKNRFYLAVTGTMPVSKTLPYEWFNTPNIHFCSIKDFENICSKLNFEIKNRVYLTNNSKLNILLGNRFIGNICAEYGLFLITKNEVKMAEEHQLSDKSQKSFSGVKKFNPTLANNDK
ncbi:MAG: methionine biosynthesis protein MetW [Lentimonas sp.]|jgi:methionine biosynthesis protein MetW